MNKLHVEVTKGRGGDNRDRITKGVYVFRAYVEPFDGASKLTFTLRTQNNGIGLAGFIESVADWLRDRDYWCPIAKCLTVHYNRNNTSGHSKLVLFIPEEVITELLWDIVQFGQPNYRRRWENEDLDY